MPVQNLQDDPQTNTYSNIPEFVNSLFDSDVRVVAPINNAINQNRFSVGFSSDSTNYEDILNAWVAGWRNAQGDDPNPIQLDHLPAGDQPILAFLSNYLKDNNLSMFVPQVSLVSTSSSGPVYQLNSYRQYDLMSGSTWNYSDVQMFLSLLLFGGHFVVIHSPEDLPNGPEIPPLWNEFKADDSLKGSERTDIAYLGDAPVLGNSHYTSVTNLNGEYYPIVDQESAPDPCPFILSLLICPTNARVGGPPPGQYNTFMQLEGWELPPSVFKALGSRHGQDYSMSNQTHWNISTYGACAYSEKRATAIFLAPASAWVPVPTPGTYMPPYAGAETPQSWLKTDLVQLPPGLTS